MKTPVSNGGEARSDGGGIQRKSLVAIELRRDEPDDERIVFRRADLALRNSSRSLQARTSNHFDAINVSIGYN